MSSASAVSIRRARQLRTLPGDTLRALSRRSDAAGALRLLIHVGLLACGTVLVLQTQGTPWLVPAMLLQGLVIVALFAVMHEGVHYTAFATRRVNEIAAFLGGAAILYVSPFYRQFHLVHHRHTQDPDRDPELLALPPLRSRREFWLRVTALPYWRLRLEQLADLVTGRFAAYPFLDAQSQHRSQWAARAIVLALAVGIGLSIWFQSLVMLWCWAVPVLIAMPFLRLYLMCEHGDCSEDDDAFSNTRTVLAAWPVRLLMWNMPHHAEHHLYPSIPFHALPAAHRLLAPHLNVIAPSYLSTLRQLYRSCPAPGARV